MLDFSGDVEHVEAILGDQLHLALLRQRLVLVDNEQLHVALPAAIDDPPPLVLPSLHIQGHVFEERAPLNTNIKWKFRSRRHRNHGLIMLGAAMRAASNPWHVMYACISRTGCAGSSALQNFKAERSHLIIADNMHAN